MTHTLEILVMLGVALLLGALLYHLAAARRRGMLRDLQREVDRLQALEVSLTHRLQTSEKELDDVRADLADTARVLADKPAGGELSGLGETLTALREQQRALTDDVAALRREIERLGAPPVARI